MIERAIDALEKEADRIADHRTYLKARIKETRESLEKLGAEYEELALRSEGIRQARVILEGGVLLPDPDVHSSPWKREENYWAARCDRDPAFFTVSHTAPGRGAVWLHAHPHQSGQEDQA